VNHEEMIRKSRWLFNARRMVWLVTMGLVLLVYSMLGSLDTLLDVAPMAAPAIAGTLVGLLMLSVSRQHNRRLAACLSVDEIRQLLRIYGRDTSLHFGAELSDVLPLCLPRLVTRDQLSEAEWKIVGSMSLRGIDSATKALVRAQVWEVNTWAHRSEPGEQPLFVNNSKPLRALSNLTADERATLPRFAEAVPDTWNADDFIAAAQHVPALKATLRGFVLFAVGCIAVSLATRSGANIGGSIGLFLVMLSASLISPIQPAVATFPPAHGTLRDLLVAVKGARHRTRRRILISALGSAIRVSTDFSELRHDDFLILLGLLDDAAKADRESISQTLQAHAPASLLPDLGMSTQRWLQSSRRDAPAWIEELTRIRMGIIGRGNLSHHRSGIQEVP